MAFLSRETLETMGFKKLGQNVLISDKASIYKPSVIEIGDNVRIDDFCILSPGDEGITIGNYIHIGCQSTLIGRGKITLEDFSNISSKVSIYSSNDDYSGDWMTNPMVPEEFTNVTELPVTIKKHTIIGASSVILPGVTIGECCSVGSLSLVKKSIEDGWIVAGTPAKKIKKRNSKLKELETQLSTSTIDKRNMIRVGLTITSCKRLNLFEKSINSLSNNLKGKSIISKIIHYDDSSSEQDRIEMYNMLQSNFPDAKIINKYFEKESFSTQKRHMEIMRIWKKDISEFDFVFHTEDDWLFTKDFEIVDAINFMKNNQEVAQVGFSQVLRNPPEEYGKVNIKQNFWEWIYKPELPNQHHLFMDYDEMNLSNIPGYWCYFINWPHFGFRPSIIDVSKLSTLDNFSENGGSFELDFATKYSHKYKSYFTLDKICTHIGDTSSYDLNESQR